MIPHVNTFVKTIRAVPIRCKVENLPVVGKSFVTIPAGSGAVKLEITKGSTLCIHVYSRLEEVRRDSQVDFQLKNRIYASPLLTNPVDAEELLTILATLLPMSIRNGYDAEQLVNEIENAILPLLKKSPKFS